MNELSWIGSAPYPLLATLQLLPLLGAVLLAWRGERRGGVLFARMVALLELLLIIDLYRRLAPSATMQFSERVNLWGPFSYHVAADGLTVLFLLLAGLIVFLLTIYSLARNLDQPSHLLAVILAIEAVLVSLLVTLNLMWFTLASIIEIALVGYLLWHWATSPERDQMMARFYQFHASGLLLLLAGTLMAGWAYHDAAGGRWSFDLLDLASTPVTGTIGTVTFFLLFYALAIRTPLFPLHGWLPISAQHGNVAVAPALMLGVKIGIYGMLRYVLPIVPEAVTQWHQAVVAFAVTGVFYAAFLAFLQTNLRRLMAFSVVSHTSLVVIGLFTLHAHGFQGAALLAINFGLAATVMLFMVGFVYRRTGTASLHALGGLFDRIPFIGITFFVGGLAIVGMPGTPGFDAAHLVFEAAILRFGALPTVAAALGNVAAAGFLLWAFQRAFLAPRQVTGPAIEPVLAMEYLVAATVIAVLLATGFYLEPWLELIDAPLQALGTRFAPPG